MAQHNASMEKTFQSAMKHKKGGTEVATAVLAVEALMVSGIVTTAIVVNTDAKVLQRARVAMSHKAFGKRLADAIATIDGVIVDEALTIVAADKPLSAQHKQSLRKVCIETMAQKSLGTAVSDMVDKTEKAVDALLVIYGVGGAKEDADVEAALTAIKAILVS